MKLGDKIPVFELINERNMLTRISPNDGKKRIIFFYPKNETRVCTEEVCSFRDWRLEFADLNYELIGISADSPAVHDRFVSNHNLNFTLLSDDGGKVRRQFGAARLLGLIPWRATFIIDETGRVVFKYEAMFEGKEHVEQVKQFIKSQNEDK